MTGYKKTEIGVIPVDWETKSVAQIATIKTGPFGTLLKASEYAVGDGSPLISVGEIRHGYIKVTDETPRVPKEVVKRLPQYVLKFGDVVFGRKGGVDRSALINEKQEGYFLGSDGISLRPSPENNSKYLAFQFQSNRVQSWLLHNAIGTTMASINQGIIAKAIIPIPKNKTEQQAIATALSDADELIESLEQLLAKKRDIKQGVMQELLTGNIRLIGFNTPWVKKPLGDVINFLEAGVSVNAIDDENVDCLVEPCVLKTSSVGGGKFNPKEVKKIVSDEIIRATLNPKKDTIIISRMNTPDLVGECGYIDRDFDNLFIPDRLWMIKFRPDAQVSAKWLSYALNLDINKAEIKSAAAGTSGSMKNLSKGSFLKLDIYFPLFEEQTAIATILSDMDAEITALETKLEKARQIKQGMMQELLTGRIRLV